jgi:WD40 repeat protein
MSRKTFISLLAGASFLTTIAYLGPAVSTAIAQNLTHQIIAQSPSNKITVTNLQEFKGVIQALALSPDGKTLIVAGGDGNITAINLSNSQQEYSQKFKINDLSNIAISADGEIFAAAEKKDISVFRLSNGDRKMTLRGHAGLVSGIAISPDRQTLVSISGEDSTIRVWNLENGNLIETIGKDIGPLREVTFSPDGKYFVTASVGEYRYIKFWDAATLNLLKTYPQQSLMDGLAITPDGKKLVASVKNYVKVWDIASGKQLLNLKGPRLDINTIAVSPDGRLVATANKEGTIMLFDIVRGKLLTTLRGHEGWVLSVAFSPDGRYLYSGAEDKLVKIWQLN